MATITRAKPLSGAQKNLLRKVIQTAEGAAQPPSPSLWANTSTEGMETLQSFSATVLGLLSLQAACSATKSCTEPPPSHGWVFLG